MPPCQNPLPIIIVLSESGGGIDENLSQLLSSHGYAVLALGYFGMEGLQDIPLEYFETAFKWIQSQSNLDGSNMYLWNIKRRRISSYFRSMVS